MFDQQAFTEAVGITAAAIAQAGITGSQGGPSNLKRFRAHHPPIFTGGGDPMVANHWFKQIEKVLEAMGITSDATRIRLAAFQLEGEAQVWWKWARTSRDLEVMTWAEFQELFMGKYFPEIAKAKEFLELKQRTTTMMDYVTRFTELVRFIDDYVTTNLAKVRRFENGLKLSIRARIIGLRLQDMDSMVGTTLTTERELGLEVETLKEPLYVSSPIGIRARIGMICRGCELEMSGTLLTVDLRIMDMSEFDVILGMDWLTAYRIVIDVSVGGLPPTHWTVLVWYFRGTSMTFCPRQYTSPGVRDNSGLASEPYPRRRGETRLRSTSSSVQICGCFPR